MLTPTVRRCSFLGLAVLCVAGATWVATSAQDFAGAEFRRWTTSEGVQSSVQLRAVAIVNSKVRLEREDGRFVELKLSQLSAADRQYLRHLKTSAAEPESPTTPVATSATAGDWPRWRGPNNDGVSSETGLLKSWPEEGPEVNWSAEGLGSGYSSVSIWDGKIYTMGKKQGQTHLICISIDGGKPIWETPLGGGDAPNCTPTVDPYSKLVFGITHAGLLMCCDAVNGEEKWRTDFVNDLGGRMMSGWGYSESPLVDGDRVICTPGSDQGVLVALNKQTGNVIWKASMNQGLAGYASPVISHAGGIKQYVTLVGKGLIGVAADNGRLLWHYPRIANSTANVPTPIVHGDLVFGSSGYGDGGSALLRLHKQGNGIRVEEVYYLRKNQLQNHHGGMIRVGDLVYMGHGHNQGFPVCFDLKKGQPVWGPERGPGSGSAAITLADGKLYFRYEDGVMALINASPNGFQVDGQFQIKSRHGKSWAHPVISEKKLYLRDQHEIHCYNIAG